MSKKNTDAQSIVAFLMCLIMLFYIFVSNSLFYFFHIIKHQKGENRLEKASGWIPKRKRNSDFEHSCWAHHWNRQYREGPASETHRQDPRLRGHFPEEMAFVQRSSRLSLYDGTAITLDFHTAPPYADQSVLDEHGARARGKVMRGALRRASSSVSG